MTRRRSERETEPANPAALPFIIEPNAVYRVAFVQAALGLRRSSLATEAKLGHLKIARRCGRNFVLGMDLLSWLESAPSPARCPRPGQTPPQRNGTLS